MPKSPHFFHFLEKTLLGFYTFLEAHENTSCQTAAIDETMRWKTLQNSYKIVFKMTKAPLHTKLTLMDCGIGNTNLLGSSSSVLGYDCFYMKSTDGATMYFNLGSGIGSGRIQTDYWVKLREKDEK